MQFLYIYIYFSWCEFIRAKMARAKMACAKVSLRQVGFAPKCLAPSRPRRIVLDRTEQLSIGVRYLRCDQDNKNSIICEEFLEYVLQELNAEAISKTIIHFLEDCNLDLN